MCGVIRPACGRRVRSSHLDFLETLVLRSKNSAAGPLYSAPRIEFHNNDQHGNTACKCLISTSLFKF